MARYKFQLMVGFMLVTFHQSIEATQKTKVLDPFGPECSSQRSKIIPSLPTLEEMRNVDPVKTPWGINLFDVEDFNTRFRKASGYDDCNFAARVINFQTNKSDLKKTEIGIPLIQDIMDGIKLKASADLKVLEESKGSKRIKEQKRKKIADDQMIALAPLERKMEQLKRQEALALSGDKKNRIVLDAMRLSKDQIDQLPDLDAWKKMKQKLSLQQPQASSPQEGAKTLSSPPNRKPPPPPLPPRRAWIPGAVQN